MFRYWTELAISIIPHIISEVSQYHSIHHHLPTNSNWASSPTLALQAQVSSKPFNFKSTGTFKLKVCLLVHQILLFKGGVPSSGVNSHYTLAARVAVQPTFSDFSNYCSKVNQNFNKTSIRYPQRQYFPSVLVKLFVICHMIFISFTHQPRWFLPLPTTWPPVCSSQPDTGSLGRYHKIHSILSSL